MASLSMRNQCPCGIIAYMESSQEKETLLKLTLYQKQRSYQRKLHEFGPASLAFPQSFVS